LTETSEMPAMVPHKDAGRFNGREHHIYRDSFTAGVLAERSRAPVDAAATRRAVLAEAEKAARGGDHSECGHGEGYTDGRLDAAAAIAALAERPPAQAVDAAAIRRAALEQAATLVRAHAEGEIKSISFGPEAKFNPEGVLEIVNQISRSRLGVLADRILALAGHPPAQPVDDGWRSDMEAAPTCQQHTARRGPLVGSGGRRGGDCTRPARFVDEYGYFYCTQHAKEPATTLKKATGKIRPNLRPLPKPPAPPAPERET
jgi:hypothetical protein